MNINLLNGDVMNIPLDDKSVHCIVTSPPYWGLRSYATGDQKSKELGSEPLHDCGGWLTGQDCGVCFVCHVRQYARELWRVLRDDGVMWLNLGDSYAAGGLGGDSANFGKGTKKARILKPKKAPPGLKPKDLCGVPWRVALALQADGWYLRSDIIWHKPNPMPESVTDRPTKAHEYLFLMTKSKRYYYDADAVRIQKAQATVTDPRGNNNGHRRDRNYPGANSNGGTNLGGPTGGRNRRTVWKIATAPYSGAHFATFPPKLVEPCIQAGTSERGCCTECGKPWVRVVEKVREHGLSKVAFPKSDGADSTSRLHRRLKAARDAGEPHDNALGGNVTIGFRPSCECHGKIIKFRVPVFGEDYHRTVVQYIPFSTQPPPIPCTVFDPFSGSGTTVMVANQLGRRGIGLDLSTDYIELAQQRTGLTAWDAWQNGIKVEEAADLGPMFNDLP